MCCGCRFWVSMLVLRVAVFEVLFRASVQEFVIFHGLQVVGLKVMNSIVQGLAKKVRD